jgi:hypothetical protein
MKPIDYAKATPEERRKAMAKARADRKRAEENARFSQEFDRKKAEIRHEISRKFE